MSATHQDRAAPGQRARRACWRIRRADGGTACARDVAALGALLCELRDRGNSVLVVEHDPDIMAIADHLIDMGPGAGTVGEPLWQGDYPGLRKAGTVTGRGLASHVRRGAAPGTHCWVTITRCITHNLRRRYPDSARGDDRGHRRRQDRGRVAILGHLRRPEPGTVVIDQQPIRGSRRSTRPRSGMLDPIRRLFAKTTGTPIGLFTANSTGGCTECDGGVIYTDLAFPDGVLARAKRAADAGESQAITIDGVSIADVYR